MRLECLDEVARGVVHFVWIPRKDVEDRSSNQSHRMDKYQTSITIKGDAMPVTVRIQAILLLGK